MKNVFNQTDANEIIDRINKLTPDAKALWGKMNVAQMLAHCNVTYEMVYENKHPKPKGFMKFILKAFIKPSVVSEKPYKITDKPLLHLLLKKNEFLRMKKNV